jgi:hypothetical protein
MSPGRDHGLSLCHARCGAQLLLLLSLCFEKLLLTLPAASVKAIEPSQRRTPARIPGLDDSIPKHQPSSRCTPELIAAGPVVQLAVRRKNRTYRVYSSRYKKLIRLVPGGGSNPHEVALGGF